MILYPPEIWPRFKLPTCGLKSYDASVRRYWIDLFFFFFFFFWCLYSNGSSWLIFLCVKSTYRTHWQSCSNIFSMCIDLSVNYIMFIVGEEKCRQGYMLLTDNHCLHMPPKMFSICTVSPSGFLNTSCLSHVEFVVFRLDVAISIFSFFLLYWKNKSLYILRAF